MSGTIIESNFKPAWWLSNPHLQTMWPTLIRREVHLELHYEYLELPDGDFLELAWAGENQGKLVLILHGLAGSLNSSYAKGMMQAMVAKGWRVVFMHFRGCGKELNRLPRSYHSGETSDLNFVVNELLNRGAYEKMAAIGISLGGNVLLKWLGETGMGNPLTCAAAVSIPFELNSTADRMCQGFSQCYQRYLLYRLKKDVIKKFENMTAPIEINGVKDMTTFWEFDDKITAPLHGFKNAVDYYHQSSSKQFLKNIATPALIIHAEDDPFMTSKVIPTENELSKNVILELSKKGGHVGFIFGEVPGRAQYWLDQRIPEYLEAG